MPEIDDKIILIESIRIIQEAQEALLHHARSLYPHECCGVLLRSNNETQEAYSTFVPLINNAKNTLHNFELEPTELLNIIFRYPKDKWDMLFVHSHPNEAPRLSDADLTGMSLSSSLFHGLLIISLQNGLHDPVYAYYNSVNG
ncbi:Mov34/MPN/PAD-1 family protein [Paenibacillus marinisediminis]